MKIFAREAAVALLFVVLAIAMTWPLAPNIRYAISDPGDPFYTTWTLDWDDFATVHRRPLFQANIFHPTRDSLALSEHLYGIALFLFPLFAIGMAPLTIHNVAMLAGFAACGYAMYRLARRVTGSTAAGIIGGIAYAFVGIRFHHLPHIQFVWSMWLPVLLLALLAFVERPDVPRAAGLAAATVINGLTAIHWLAFGSVAVSITAIAIGRIRERRFWLLLIAAGAVSSIALAPFLLPYTHAAQPRDTKEVLEGSSAAWSDWLQPNYQNKLYGRFSSPEAYTHERTLMPGIGVYVLAIVGLIAGARRTPAYVAAILWIALGALGARGLHGWFGSLLFHSIPGFQSIRMPARWAMIAFVGIALLAAIGAARLMGKHSWVIGCAIAAALLFELRVAPIRWYLIPTEPRPVYEWLRSQNGAIFERPMTQEQAYESIWRATVHHRPLINGESSFTPPDYDRLVASYAAHPIGFELYDELETRGCSVIVVHEAALRDRGAEIREWLRKGIDAHRIAYVRRFDAGRHGDFVFAMTHEPRSLPPEAETFLRAGIVRFDNTAGKVDIGPASLQRGDLEVIGWATSAAGIDHVDLRFANGAYVVRADRTERDDVRAILPWHPNVYGFRKVVHPLIEGDTDMQVEIVDNEGRRVRMAPFWFRWER